ncbi:arylesterase [Thioclava sp. SK-1]|uniref:SGNH/GDSL hydrolase family protein n=1 Tax=Thioclava sp. SK-1 TaxID=1889770 RepID=UPI00082502D8|nr:SGNH/GDSL hydrolase family protein [Thioclava sp. SK-1]OCX67244.1 arylesterase [Thioclava sp. SK-1]
MARILCYGDSLTWGHNIDSPRGLRHAPQDQWPEVLAAGLPKHRVLADGVGGRTTCFDDHSAPCCRNGVRSLPVALSAHMPLDLVIVMLGTNDLKPVYGGVAIAAQAGMRRLIELIQTFPYKPRIAPKIMIVAPPICIAPQRRRQDSAQRPAQSQLFASLYAELAEETGVAYFNAANVARPSPIDGVHLDAENTRAIGAALIDPVRALLA